MCAPIETPASTARSSSSSSSTAQRGRRSARRSRRRPGAGAGDDDAVAARVVGDHAVAGALQRARAHHDVAPRGASGRAAARPGRRSPVVGRGERHARAPAIERSSIARAMRRQAWQRRARPTLRRMTVIDVERGRFRGRGARAIRRGPGRRRLLGAVVRALPAARPGAREGRRGARRQGRAREDRHRREPGHRPSASASRASPPSRRSATARSSRSSSARRPPAQVEQFFDGLVPSETQLLLDAGDEASLRKAVELDPKNVDAALRARPAALPRGRPRRRARALRQRRAGNFRADGLAARIELERRRRRPSVRRGVRARSTTASSRTASTC